MSKEYNSQAFTPEEVKKGLHLDLINYLLSYNEKSEGFFNDIHIDSDGYCVIIEWVTESYTDSCTSFEFVGSDEEILKIVHYPDNSYGYASDEDEANDMFLLWLRENPGWERNSYGVWHKVINSNDEIKEILD